MERNLLRERTRAGLTAARARGRLGGRKPRLTADGLDTARRLMADPTLSMEEIASRVGVGRTTLYRALGRAAEAAAASGDGSVAAKTGRDARPPGRKPRPSAARGGLAAAGG
jgi:DNA invertase Pin-like site-specific DNA recombinase